MNKLIIDNRTDLGESDALQTVQKVVALGRISNNDKQYCYAVNFDIDGKCYIIFSSLNKKSDRFTIVNRNSDNSRDFY